MVSGSRPGEKAFGTLTTGVWVHPRSDLCSLGVEKNLRTDKRFPYTGLGRLFGLREVKASRTSKQSVNEGGKIVSPTHGPSLPPRDTPDTLVDPRATVRLEGLHQ